MQLPNSQFRLLQVICLISATTEFGMITALLPFVTKDAGASPLQHSLIMSAFFICQIFGLWLRGTISDRYGRKLGLMIALLGSLVGTAMLYSFSSSIIGLLISRIVCGFFNGTSLHAIAIVADTTKGDDQLKRIGIIEGMFWLGSWTVGTALIGVFQPLGLQNVLLVAVGLSIFNCILGQFFFKDISHAAAASTTNEVEWMTSGLKLFFKNPIISGLLLLVMTYGFGTSMWLGTAMLYFNERFGFDAQKMSFIFAFAGIMQLIAVYNVNRLVKFFGSANIMVLGATLIMISQVMQGPLHDFIAPSLSLLVFGMVAQLVGASLFITIVVHRCMIHAPDSMKATAYGIVRGTIICCRGIAPVAGILYTTVSISAPFYLSAVILMGTIFLTIRWNKSIKKYEVIPVSTVEPQPLESRAA